MGRIKTREIKNISSEFMERYPDKFSSDFEKNKKVLEEMKIILDKKTRNKVCGYISHRLRIKPAS